MNRLIVLTGAPENKSLDWSEKQLINHAILMKPPSVSNIQTNGSFQQPRPQWRRLTDENGVEKAQVDEVEDTRDQSPSEPTLFLTPNELVSQGPSRNPSFAEGREQSITSIETTSDTQSEFYDHSFAVHQDVPASLLAETDTDALPTGRSSFDSDAGTPMSPSSAIRAPVNWPIWPAPVSQHLSDLEDIPSAKYLRSIEPQTMTVNLIVGILSIAPPRTVTTGARWGKERPCDLVELLVGDETKTGFCITLWLPPEMHVTWKDGAQPSPDRSRSMMRRSLKLLRPRDVILLRNVALGSFQNKVHGQSLRRDVTKVDLLYRKKNGRDDIGGSYTVQAVNNAVENDSQLMKVRRVRDWLVEFVVDHEHDEAPRRRKGSSRRLPPDTQP
jgi:hypothetical protein